MDRERRVRREWLGRLGKHRGERSKSQGREESAGREVSGQRLAGVRCEVGTETCPLDLAAQAAGPQEPLWSKVAEATLEMGERGDHE